MVVKIRWPVLWPPLISKKFQVKLVVLGLHNLPQGQHQNAMVEVVWKGPKSALRSIMKKDKKEYTRDAAVGGDGKVEWNQEYASECTLTSNSKDCSVFHPWEIFFAITNGSRSGIKDKGNVIGTTSLNLAEFAFCREKGKEIQIPVSLECNTEITESSPSLHLSLSFLELRTPPDSPEMMHTSIAPLISPSNTKHTPSSEKDDLSILKRRLKMLKDFVTAGRSKKTCQEDESSEERFSLRSDDAGYSYPFDTDSMDNEVEKEDGERPSNFRKSFSYGTLASANYCGGSIYSEMRIDGEFNDWVYYSHRRSNSHCSHAETVTTSNGDLSSSQTIKKNYFAWKGKKLSFKPPKPKGEPLLKAYGELGGDDIDFDRRQMSSSDESMGWHKVDDNTENGPPSSDFGDDNFIIGSWEVKEIASRDGKMKLFSQVFFASIDQRSERAAGESACTALVAVIADWFQNNLSLMPIKSQFDNLIRDGSLEWRKLCENETYREKFPDKHFDLETVLQAKIRPLSVSPNNSFVGFFHPEDVSDVNHTFDFLHGAMSFDSIWEEISQAATRGPTDGSPQLYIVSWNDHFFILKVEPNAYYVIDTLGERLFEGCDQAYILKFDENTSIQMLPAEEKSVTEGDSADSANPQYMQKNPNPSKEGCSKHFDNENDKSDKKQEFVCRGKESCKEYIKSFLAAIPLRELQDDVKKGLRSSTPIHHRLQIEFHYTEMSKESAKILSKEMETITELTRETVVIVQESEVIMQSPETTDFAEFLRPGEPSR